MIGDLPTRYGPGHVVTIYFIFRNTSLSMRDKETPLSQNRETFNLERQETVIQNILYIIYGCSTIIYIYLITAR
jgi:hypothetical protein